MPKNRANFSEREPEMSAKNERKPEKRVHGRSGQSRAMMSHDF